MLLMCDLQITLLLSLLMWCLGLLLVRKILNRLWLGTALFDAMVTCRVLWCLERALVMWLYIRWGCSLVNLLDGQCLVSTLRIVLRMLWARAVNGVVWWVRVLMLLIV